MNRFHRDGWVQLRGVLDAPTVAGFVDQIREEMAGTGAESGTGAASDRTLQRRVVLEEASTWPRKGARRVIETAPVCHMTGADGNAHCGSENSAGVGVAFSCRHWENMRGALAPALDAIMGTDGWELPFNTPGSPTRHFYCPIVMPEVVYPPEDVAPTAVATSRGGATTVSTVQASTNATTGDAVTAVNDGKPIRAPRPVLLESWKDEIRRTPFTNEALDASSRWQPVSRRRFRGKGWHVDIGPGFSTDAARTAHGHPYQGLVVLLLLSDWLPGGGGTVMVPGSQEWVRQRLESAGPEGIVHQELNAYCVSRMIEAVRAGRVLIPPATAADDVNPDSNTSSSERKLDNGGYDSDKDRGYHNDIMLHQICGKAGDVVLMHPWLVHSGTTNLRSTPRLMANGMVRVRAQTFVREGCRVLRGTDLSNAPKKKRKKCAKEKEDT